MFDPKIKIRYFITVYKPIYSGAAESLSKLVNSINKNKFDIEIITAFKKGLPKIEKRSNIKIIRLGISFFSKRDDKLTAFEKFWFSMHAFFFNLKYREYDIIHFIGFGKLGLPSYLVSKLLKKIVFIKYTSYKKDDPCKIRSLLGGRFIIKLLKNDYHWFISLSLKNAAKLCTDWDSRRFIVLPNPVNVKYKNWQKLQILKKRKRKDYITFLFVGIINYRKGVDILIDLWSRYNIEAELILAGPLDKKDKNTCEKFQKLLLSRRNVKWVGKVERAQLENLYLSSDVFLFPSRLEGLPNVILEAMSFGVPVISNFLPGITDFLIGSENERGILIHSNSLKEWYRVITKIINDSIFFDSLRQKSWNAFYWVLKNASVNMVASKMENIYIKSLKRNGLFK